VTDEQASELLSVLKELVRIGHHTEAMLATLVTRSEHPISVTVEGPVETFESRG
jgi:hypothetical protein